jgi:ribonuclease D
MKTEYITSITALSEIIPKLKAADRLYIDLEFDKNHYHFGFNLCLMQINDGSTNYLIDPIAIESLDGIYEILENQDLQKVCYAFGEDIRLLQYLGCFPKNLYDIAIARSIINLPQVSLESALGFEISKEKSQQKSNWCSRPLSEKQLHYAAEDVRHLPSLHQSIDASLSQLNRKDWLQQEMDFFTNRIYEHNLDPTANFQKYRKEMNAVAWSRLTKLLVIIDKHAALINRPAYRVLRKDIVLSFANDEDFNPTRLTQQLHRLIDKKAFINDLSDLEYEVSQEIKNKLINPQEGAQIQLSKNEKIRLSQIRKRNNAWSDHFFRPIKAYIAEEYGENFANFLLSNRKIQLFCDGNPILPYQVELLKSAAQKLNLTIPPLPDLESKS